MERRRSERYVPDGALRVVDHLSGKEAGIVVNISAGGLLLMTPLNIEEQGVFQFKLLTESGGDSGLDIVVGATCLWSMGAQTEGSHWGGFRIIDISEDDKASLLVYLNALKQV